MTQDIPNLIGSNTKCVLFYFVFSPFHKYIPKSKNMVWAGKNVDDTYDDTNTTRYGTCVKVSTRQLK